MAQLKKSTQFKGVEGPLVTIVMDGVGIAPENEGNAVYLASTPTLEKLMKDYPTVALKAHGTAVGLPSDDDMGNSEVGHNALGSGQVFAQGAKLVSQSIESGDHRVPAELGQESQASSCLRKGTPLASRVAQGVSGPSSSCVWNPRVFADDARGWQCPFVLCLPPQCCLRKGVRVYTHFVSSHPTDTGIIVPTLGDVGSWRNVANRAWTWPGVSEATSASSLNYLLKRCDVRVGQPCVHMMK